MLKHLFLLPLIAITLLTACSDEPVSVVYIIRHAEKDLTDTTDNPALTPAGEERAQRLVGEIGDVELDGIFSTAFDRNMNTVKPLAEAKKVAIENYEWHNWQPVVDKIKQQPGKNFVICGHGDNMLPMITAFGGRAPVDSLGKHEYDKIFRLELRADTTMVEMTSY